MIVIITALLLATTAPQVDGPKETLVDRIVRIGCRGNHPTREMAQELLDIEKEAGFTGVARGLLAAAACNESGFNPLARGDWRSLIDKRKSCRRRSEECAPISMGIVQLGAWSRRGLRKMGSTMPEPRFDWRIAARFWAKHVVAQIDRVRAKCPKLRRGWGPSTPEADVWRAAHRTAVTFPKCGKYRMRGGKQKCTKWIPRCHRLGKRYRSSHWRILATWKGEKELSPEKWKGIPRAVNLPVKTAVVP